MLAYSASRFISSTLTYSSFVAYTGLRYLNSNNLNFQPSTQRLNINADKNLVRVIFIYKDAFECKYLGEPRKN